MTWADYSTEVHREDQGDYQYYEPKVCLPPAATATGTACLLAGIVLAYTLYPAEETPAAMASVAASAVGIAFLVSVFFDSRKGLRNLFRTDLLCLIGIYGLTLAEFLFPQEEFNGMTTVAETINSINTVLLGMGGLAIGRHGIPVKPMRSKWLRLEEISNKSLFQVFVISSFVGFLYMLMSVQFNPIALINGMMGPRFSEPWTRGRLGGWSSLIIELGLLRYIIPPLTGVIWNRRRSFSSFQILVVMAIFALTIFYAFSSGTRNIFIAYIATFIMGYLLTLPKNTFRNTILPILLAGFICVYGSYHMLEFRSMGLQNYLTNRVYASGNTRDTLAVDYNLASIGPIVDAFPENHPFLGMEIITWSLVRPIPRVFLPGKPEGLSVSIEEIVGAEGWTVAATYLGESYMMAGWAGVIGMSLFFGALSAWWNRMAVQDQSDYALVVYALGFFAAGITMRSMFWLTTAMLPVIALIVFRKFGPVR